MPPNRGRPTFDDPALVARINGLRRVDNWTNLGYLARDYLCLAATIGVAITFAELRGSWGLAWGWNVPVFTLAIFLVGGLQHRLAGLGHEACHYTLLKNRFANDFVADLLCMFPILSTIHLYRLFHMAHHQYTNNPWLDPDLVNMGRSKRLDEIPMPRWRFIILNYLRPLVAPRSFVRYQWDYLYVNTLGKGNNVYMRRMPDGDAHDPHLRLGTTLGLVYLVALIGLSWWLNATGRSGWLVPSGLAALTIAAAVTLMLPDRVLFRSPFRQAYSSRFSSVVRLAYYTLAIIAVAVLRVRFGWHGVLYPWLLWILPMGTAFMSFMLLRDVYQHANADDGRLTNSRVFYTDPLTRWAVFIYGQDVHVTHHLFPAIPHYRLRDLHDLLRNSHAEYAAKVVECHGTLTNGKGLPTLLDVMAEPRPAEPRRRRPVEPEPIGAIPPGLPRHR